MLQLRVCVPQQRTTTPSATIKTWHSQIKKTSSKSKHTSSRMPSGIPPRHNEPLLLSPWSLSIRQKTGPKELIFHPQLSPESAHFSASLQPRPGPSQTDYSDACLASPLAFYHFHSCPRSPCSPWQPQGLLKIINHNIPLPSSYITHSSHSSAVHSFATAPACRKPHPPPPPLSRLLILFQPHQSPHCFSNTPGLFLPQDLCTCCSLCLVCCSPGSCLTDYTSSLVSRLGVSCLERPSYGSLSNPSVIL